MKAIRSSGQGASWRLSAFAGISAATVVQAGDLFQIDAFGPGGQDISAGGNSLPNFVTEMIKGQGPFSQLANQPFNASLTYGDVRRALQFNISQNGNAWTASLTSPFDPGLISHNFQAQTRDGLDAAIRNYLKQDGATDLARFLGALDKNSAVGSLDGNPAAVTAQSATVSYMAYAMRPTETAEEADSPAKTSRVGVEAKADGGVFSARSLEGQTFSLTPTIPISFGEESRVRLELSLPLNYTRIEGADQYRVGAVLAVPVTVVKRTKDQPWLWQLTPSGGAIVSGSIDMVSGGALGSGGLSSYLSYRWNDWDFSMGNQVTFFEGVKISVSDYTFDPEVSQQIVKNGLKLGRSLGQRWYAEVYAIDTEFTQAAFLSRYTTLGGAVGYRGAKKKGYFMVGAYTDIGANFQAGHFEFGTGWKF